MCGGFFGQTRALRLDIYAVHAAATSYLWFSKFDLIKIREH